MAKTPGQHPSSSSTFSVRGGLVEMVYAAGPNDVKGLQKDIVEWKKSIIGNAGPKQKSALELAEYGVRRWAEAYKEEGTAHTVKRMNELVVNNPHSDVRMLAIAKVSWLQDIGIKTVGMCMFRRTWCNNLCLEIVAAHPELDEKEDSPISGLGTGLLHHVFSLAEEIKAGSIWGECTQNSKKFYEIFLEKPTHLQDLVILRRKDYLRVKTSIEQVWKSSQPAPDGPA